MLTGLRFRGPGTGDHADSSLESNSGSVDLDSEPDGGLSSDSKDSNESDEGVFSDMFSARKTHKLQPVPRNIVAKAGSYSLPRE